MYIFDEETLQPRFYKVFGIDANGDEAREEKRVNNMIAALSGRYHSDLPQKY